MVEPLSFILPVFYFLKHASQELAVKVTLNVVPLKRVESIELFTLLRFIPTTL